MATGIESARNQPTLCACEKRRRVRHWFPFIDHCEEMCANRERRGSPSLALFPIRLSVFWRGDAAHNLNRQQVGRTHIGVVSFVGDVIASRLVQCRVSLGLLIPVNLSHDQMAGVYLLRSLPPLRPPVR